MVSNKKQFYSHIIETESVVVRLHELGLSDDEKAHLIALMDSSLHHTILDAILSELSPHDKKLFLQTLATENDEEIWKFLKSKIDGIEDKIRHAAEGLKKELHQDIDTVHKK
ncbi:MAG TPA: hypothetical protein VG935_01430 [Patescibacteria group bacterium]|nr:hypothetical protein [Patescibacteria group bacterium]